MRFIPEHGPSWEGWKEHLPGRSVDSITARKCKLGLQGPRGVVRPWSEAEDSMVRKYFGMHPASWDGWGDVLPGRSGGSIRKRAEALGIKGVGSGANFRERSPKRRSERDDSRTASRDWTEEQQVALVKSMRDMVDTTGHEVKECLEEFARIVGVWKSNDRAA